MTEMQPFLSQEQQIAKLHKDNQELRIKNYSLLKKVHTDTLTQVPNREFLSKRFKLEVKLSLDTQIPLAALLIDVDHFHNYNERHGHPEGDKALKRIARILRLHSKSTDLISVARYGGEEFLALIPGADEWVATKIAERLRNKVQDVALDTKEQITISIGIAICPDHGSNVDSLLVAADRAMYQAKAAGRNQLSVAPSFSLNVPLKGAE